MMEFFDNLGGMLDESEALIARQQEWLSPATQESIDEFYRHIETLTLDEAETALNGLREYEKEVLKDRDILLGRERFVD